MTGEFDRAAEAIRAATTEAGILAGTDDSANYRRVWCRDGVIAGLAGLLADDETIIRGLRSTLRTLADAQGPSGQIPSNVLHDDGNRVEVSYGSTCGRVDTPAWFVIGLVHYVLHTGYPALGQELEAHARRALQLYDAWEWNARGLVYVPQGGDWADEYVLHGYVLNVQLLRLWALRCFADATDDERLREKARRLEDRIERTFWPSADTDPESTYHPVAFRQFLEEHGEADWWLPALKPGGYATRFDGWSNALALLLGLGDEQQRASVLRRAESIRRERPRQLLPAFWPPIEEDDPEWDALRTNRRSQFSNAPGRYHNGGLWPVVNGFWGAGLADEDEPSKARRLLESISEANLEADPPFPEYLDATDGTPGGTAPCTWSAAGSVLLHCRLRGERLSFGR